MTKSVILEKIKTITKIFYERAYLIIDFLNNIKVEILTFDK